jgi:hypothetical protein
MKNKFLLILLILVSGWLGIRAQVPVFNSYPSANATIYLDFDGQTVSGTLWNWSGTIYAQPTAISTTGIEEICNRVAEDFRPFNLNITTDSTKYWSAPIFQRVRIIVSPTHGWYGSVGGVAFVGSFVFGDNTPAWVFSSLLYNSPKLVAEATSHEIGHTLGLQHQSDFDASCSKLREYSTGAGTGEIGWAPIMGVGYNKNVTTWHFGPNTAGCNSLQDDFAIINSTINGFGLRNDDYANNYADASPIIFSGPSFGISGLINKSDDVDVFSFDVAAASHFSLRAIPQNVGLGNMGANIDIQVSLLNNTGDTIALYNPSTLLNAGIDTLLNTGNYFLVVDGIGNIYHSDYGSMGSYTLQGFLGGSILTFNQFELTAQKQGDIHQLSWSYETDETITQLSIESSTDGVNFITLSKLNSTTFKYSVSSQKNTTYYRLRAITSNNNIGYLSNIVAISGNYLYNDVRIIGSEKGILTLNSNGNFSFQLMNSNGQLLLSGKLKPGNNQLFTNIITGLFILRYHDGKNQQIKRFFQ